MFTLLEETQENWSLNQMQGKSTVPSLSLSFTDQGTSVLNIQVALAENGSLQSSQQSFGWTRYEQADSVMGPALTINLTDRHQTTRTITMQTRPP